MVWACHDRGFQVCNILWDEGFKCIRNNLADMGITLNVDYHKHCKKALEHMYKYMKRAKIWQDQGHWSNCTAANRQRASWTLFS